MSILSQCECVLNTIHRVLFNFPPNLNFLVIKISHIMLLLIIFPAKRNLESHSTFLEMLPDIARDNMSYLSYHIRH